MIALGSLAVALVTSAAMWAGMRRTMRAAPALQRSNYRGAQVPVAAGIVAAVSVLAVVAAHHLWIGFGGVDAGEAGRALDAFLVGTLGFALLGLYDDLAGAGDVKGFRGHLRALARGDVTSGVLKLGGGLALAVVCVPGDFGVSLRGGLVIAACANLANLFDRAPGRVIKASVAGGVVVAALGGLGWSVAPTMIVVGAGVGLLWADLREECMLGDTGANMLGAAVGFGLVVSLDAVGEWLVLLVVVALNLASEFVSFSAVIDRVAPLRALDRLGTRPERRSTPS